VNPAEEVVRKLDGASIKGTSIQGAVLPVTYDTLLTKLRELIETERPSGVIATGLWPGEPMIRLERFAVNLNAFEIPDNTGQVEYGPINPEGELAYKSTLPIDAIRARLLKDGIPARTSSSAGNFLCNAAMFCVLEAVSDLGLDIPCGFIHVPYLPEQVADILKELEESQALELHQRGDLASMDLDVTVQAIRIAIATTMEAAA
jgi:pyroglutamyl-peptidase